MKTLNEYQLELWRTRSELQRKGIHKPVNEMIKAGLLEKDPNNSNYILGRIRSKEFLEKLINFNNSIE